MRVLVYDVAASSSGALSILQEYHARYCQENGENDYFFVIIPRSVSNSISSQI